MSRDAAELPFGLTHRDRIENYFAWLAGLFAPHFRGTVLDHGAGTGALSDALLAAGVGPLIALEPDPTLCGVLEAKYRDQPRLRVFPGTLDEYLKAAGAESLDAIVSSNVLEHVADDEGCLRTMWRCLRPGGALGLYLPARPELFGSLDEAVGHLRRYSRSELSRKLVTAGFDVEHVSYRNLFGVLPWLVAGRVLRRTAVGSQSLSLYDRVIFPIGRRVEDALRHPYGLNVLALARRR